VWAEPAKYLNDKVNIGEGKKFIKLFDDQLETLASANLTGRQWAVLLIILSYQQYKERWKVLSRRKLLRKIRSTMISNIM